MSADTRLNFFADEPWDELLDPLGIKTRFFGRPLGGRFLGASLMELRPGAPGAHYHMHYGCEEMFFVLGGTPTLRTPAGKQQLTRGDVVYCPEGRAGLHTISNPTDEPVRLLGVSADRGYPDVVAYPEHGIAWVATRNPHAPPPEYDPGIVARFELPT